MFDFILNFFEGIYNLGPILMVPAIMFLLGLVFGMGLKSSLRAALLTGIGFVGIYLILDFFLRAIGDVGMALSAKYGGATTFLDIGWSAFAAIGWASRIGLVFIPIGIISNLIMLLLKATKVLSVNIWDYWESIIAGVIVQTLTGSFALGLGFATLVHLINLKVGDWTQYLMHDYFGFEGIASYAAGYAEWGIIGKPIAWVVDRIPGLKTAKITPQELTSRYGIFGEPIFLGSVIGLVMGLVAGQPLPGFSHAGIQPGGSHVYPTQDDRYPDGRPCSDFRRRTELPREKSTRPGTLHRFGSRHRHRRRHCAGSLHSLRTGSCFPGASPARQQGTAPWRPDLHCILLNVGSRAVQGRPCEIFPHHDGLYHHRHLRRQLHRPGDEPDRASLRSLPAEQAGTW